MLRPGIGRVRAGIEKRKGAEKKRTELFQMRVIRKNMRVPARGDVYISQAIRLALKRFGSMSYFVILY